MAPLPPAPVPEDRRLEVPEERVVQSTIGHDIGHALGCLLVESIAIPRTEVQVQDNAEEQHKGPQPGIHQGLLQVVPAPVGRVGQEHDPAPTVVQHVPVGLEASPSLVAGDDQQWGQGGQEGARGGELGDGGSAQGV
eukprot:6934708-Lingulodinium_polyedra.AAC.1